MNAYMDSQVFFFISSLGFIILALLAAVILVQIVRVMHSFSRIMEKIEEDIDAIGETTREFLDDMRDNPIFRLFFKGRRKKHPSRHSAPPVHHIDVDK